MENFGKIKIIYNEMLAKSLMSENDSKSLFKGYIKSIKECEMLKTQFLVYDNIENKIESDVAKATLFLKENINLFNNFKKNEIFKANANLALPILYEKEIIHEKIDLYENISKLIFTKKTAHNIDVIVEATSEVIKYILNNKTKIVIESIDLPSSMLSSIMVDKYNEKYSDLDESDKSILKVLIDSSDEDKKAVYSNTLRECLDLINEKLINSDLESKDKLLRVKDKLLNDKQEVNEVFFENMTKLSELRTNLKNN